MEAQAGGNLAGTEGEGDAQGVLGEAAFLGIGGSFKLYSSGNAESGMYANASGVGGRLGMGLYLGFDFSWSPESTDFSVSLGFGGGEGAYYKPPGNLGVRYVAPPQ